MATRELLKALPGAVPALRMVRRVKHHFDPAALRLREFLAEACLAGEGIEIGALAAEPGSATSTACRSQNCASTIRSWPVMP